jgi:hypothetical protein
VTITELKSRAAAKNLIPERDSKDEEAETPAQSIAARLTFEEDNDPFCFSQRDPLDQKLKSQIAWVGGTNTSE